MLKGVLFVEIWKEENRKWNIYIFFSCLNPPHPDISWIIFCSITKVQWTPECLEKSESCNPPGCRLIVRTAVTGVILWISYSPASLCLWDWAMSGGSLISAIRMVEVTIILSYSEVHVARYLARVLALKYDFLCPK